MCVYIYIYKAKQGGYKLIMRGARNRGPLNISTTR